MADSRLAQVQQLVDQLSPHEQVRLLAYLTTRLAQVVAALPPTHSEIASEPSDAWESFFQLGDMLAATDSPEHQTLTAAVLAMRR
jgi:hypothetical protein